MQLRILREEDIDQELDNAIKTGLCTCFPHDAVFAETRYRNGNIPVYSAIMEDGEKIAAHLSVMDRTIKVGEKEVKVAGLANVYVMPEYRGQGLSDQLSQAAMAEAVNYQLDFGLLFCQKKHQVVYARSGWQTLADRQIVWFDADGKEASLPEYGAVMYHPLLQTEFPEGPIHLLGRDW
ncbi:MAG: GNAT family N-acetyltransferase [Armatimonadota bacterium]